MSVHDEDTLRMPSMALQEEVVRLREAIRLHRDLKNHERCWLNDAALYSSLPEGTAPPITLPPRDEFLENCAYYW